VSASDSSSPSNATLVPAPFIVLFQGRSGSTHLVSLLSSHPGVFCRNEILTFDWQGTFASPALDGASDKKQTPRVLHIGGRRYKANPDKHDIVEALDRIYRKPSIQAAGFKLKFPRQVKEFPEAQDYLLDLGDRLRIILLDRENVLKRAISKQVLVNLRNRDVSLHRQNLKNEVLFEPVTIDVEDVIHLATVTANGRAALFEFARQFENSLTIEYEQLRHAEAETMGKVLEFLDLPTTETLASEYVKVTPDRISLAVKNYDELCRAVSGSPLEAFLD